MIKKDYALFDMDGTLLDSMGYWKRVAIDYLQNFGVYSLEPDVERQLETVTLLDAARLLIGRLGLKIQPEQCVQEMNDIMRSHYEQRIGFKDGVDQYLQKLANDGVPMALVTATSLELALPCLQRLNLLPYFDLTLSCESIGVSKQRPDIYLKAAEHFNAKPENGVVYEDALFAAQTAKSANFYVVGVYDEAYAHDWEQLSSIADYSLRSWRELL